MNWYLVAVLAILLGEWALRTIVDALNVRHVSPVLPSQFEGYCDAAKYRKSQEYLRENTRFDLVSDTFMTAFLVAAILAGGFNAADGIARSFGLGDIATGLVFTGLLLLVSNMLHLPFAAYETFVIEEKYGYNRTTVRTFLLDIVKTWLVAAAIGGPLLAAVLWFFGRTGSAWLYCWAAVVCVQLFATFIAPVLIMPLFNKFTPLPAGELRTAIENYAGSQGFRMKGVFTMDGSKRSGKTNAFFAGFGRFRRLVLYDTLIARHTVPELVAVVAHEMGHCKKRHVILSLLLTVCLTGLTLFLASFFVNNAGLSEAFGIRRQSVYAGLVFFGFLYAPIMTFVSILANALSRRWEFAADGYAVATSGDRGAMESALIKLSVDNLSNLTPHPLKVFMDYSHPPILRRLAAMRRCGVWECGSEWERGRQGLL